MKTLKQLSLILLTSIVFTACSNDDDAPEPVNEEEVITTMTVTLTPNAGGTDIVLQTQDLDGNGPDAPVVTVSGDLVAGTSYSGAIVLLNETESPAEDITVEVEEEDVNHQFFYTIGTGLNASITYTNFDANGNELGTEFTLITGAAGTGNLTFTLRHEPTKPNTGLSDAGGETDIEATFSLTIQ
ncbi:type 1 periplasmic binding fold superfamily protein [Olleya sp. R77988]|uniref:type 1 periplasmic binding fold superfamily protein n=1 Tax=Olleya sp. R77988 TaxID=3093875 RepID=UPI0037CC513C